MTIAIDDNNYITILERGRVPVGCDSNEQGKGLEI